MGSPYTAAMTSPFDLARRQRAELLVSIQAVERALARPVAEPGWRAGLAQCLTWMVEAFADHVASLMDQPLWHRLRDDSIAVPGRTRIHAAEHRMIYEAIVEGDAEAAAFYSAQHINRVRTYMELSQP